MESKSDERNTHEYVAIDAAPRLSSSSSSLQHRRSKSASDRKDAILPSLENKCDELKDSHSISKLIKYDRSKQSSNQYPDKDTYSSASRSRVSLEDDQIKQLQMHLHQEKSIRLMLDRAIGRASSTLSPGHRHFSAQTRELIAEIELLEEEIANREQHVLSLYRSMFDQCVVGSSSSAHSSGMTSPAHQKSAIKKHPSIISTSFCSSKKFPLQPLPVLTSIKESRSTNALHKPKVRHESLSSENLSFHSEPVKEKLPRSARSCLARTLKDHLYQCPSKISEELVRCMAAIYCCARSDSSQKQRKTRSPFLSRSSTSIILSRQGAGDDHEWSNRFVVEISSVSTENRCQRASYAVTNYRLLVEQLERVDLSRLEMSARLAFWINIYNSLIMHAYLVYGIPQTSLRRLALFSKAAYTIGGEIITVNLIEHSILCCRTARMGRWFETILSTAMRKKSGEEKQLLRTKFGLPSCQPLVFFALCTGASSDPMLRVYTARNVIGELEKAKKEFLSTNTVVKKCKKVFLPRIVERYAKETSVSCENLIAWVSENVDKKQQEAIYKCINSHNNKRKASHVIEWLPYNPKFRYVLARELIE